MGSWTDADKAIADNASVTLTRLQGKTNASALREIERVRDAVANTRSDEHERAAAWLALCALAKKITQAPEDSSIPALYSNALRDVNGWRGVMRH
ncbi:MAG: hypothetical protein JSR61_02600 [Proteobacteria bacterium]|nr:hypothetical protein [Pseudomonadota bacterium]